MRVDLRIDFESNDPLESQPAVDACFQNRSVAPKPEYSLFLLPSKVLVVCLSLRFLRLQCQKRGLFGFHSPPVVPRRKVHDEW